MINNVDGRRSRQRRVPTAKRPASRIGCALLCLFVFSLVAAGVCVGVHFFQQQLTEQRRLALVAQRGTQAEVVAAVIAHATDESDDPRTSFRLLDQAIQYAASTRIDDQGASAQQRLLPQAQIVPLDTRVELVSARANPPACLIDLRIMDRAGRPQDGLSRVDVELTCNGQRQRRVALAQLAENRQSLNMAILLDCSTSVQGAAFESARAHTKRLIASLAPVTRIRLWSFSSEVRPLSAWTSDLTALERSLAGLQSSGGTSLYAALRQAAEDLAQQPGINVIVLFTDGTDSLRQESGDATVLLCQKHGIKVHVAALQSAELDAAFLQRLAAQTQGTYHLSLQPADLAVVWESIAGMLHVPTHRVVALGTFPVGASGQLQVGQLPAIDFSLK